MNILTMVLRSILNSKECREEISMLGKWEMGNGSIQITIIYILNLFIEISILHIYK